MNRISKKAAVFIAAGSFFIFPLQADLGLQQIVADQGVAAVSPVLISAAREAFASEDVQNQLVAILNEASQTGSADVVRYAIVAIMVAGGEGNLDASLAAINASEAFLDFPDLVALTVSEAQELMGVKADAGDIPGGGETGGGETGGEGAEEGGEEQQGGEATEEGGEEQQGGGFFSRTFDFGVNPDNPFEQSSPAGTDDGDVDVTPV